jgi:hypothetical protein
MAWVLNFFTSAFKNNKRPEDRVFVYLIIQFHYLIVTRFYEVEKKMSPGSLKRFKVVSLREISLNNINPFSRLGF